MKYKKVKAGKWIQPIRRGYRMVCCDCSLVHKMDFRVVDGRTQLRAWRDEIATVKARRKG